jgi:hypothetical protein
VERSSGLWRWNKRCDSWKQLLGEWNDAFCSFISTVICDILLLGVIIDVYLV